MNKTNPCYHAPLHPLDSERQTVGCRCRHPDFCAKNRQPKVCALARADNICQSPPHFWAKHFKKLQAAQAAAKLA